MTRTQLWSMYPPLVSVNMKQFKIRFPIYADNVWIAEIIEATKGKFRCTNPAIVDALCDANIFYTLQGRESVLMAPR